MRRGSAFLPWFLLMPTHVHCPAVSVAFALALRLRIFPFVPLFCSWSCRRRCRPHTHTRQTATVAPRRWPPPRPRSTPPRQPSCCIASFRDPSNICWHVALVSPLLPRASTPRAALLLMSYTTTRLGGWVGGWVWVWGTTLGCGSAGVLKTR